MTEPQDTPREPLPGARPPKCCPLMSNFSFGQLTQALHSPLAVAQAGPPQLGVQLYNVTCLREQCELFDEARGCCSLKKEVRDLE